MKYSWYSYLLEAESTPGPQCGWKDYVKTKIPMTPSGIESATFGLVAQCLISATVQNEILSWCQWDTRTLLVVTSWHVTQLVTLSLWPGMSTSNGKVDTIITTARRAQPWIRQHAATFHRSAQVQFLSISYGICGIRNVVGDINLNLR